MITTTFLHFERLRLRASACLDVLFASANGVLAHQRVCVSTVLSLLVLQSWLTLSHDPWLDEWQALLIAVQSPTLSALLENLRYEGHPPLWYLILRAAAQVLPLLWVLPVTQLLIAWTIQAIILFRGPFGRAERLLIGASYFILFEFGAVARSLSFGAMIAIAFFATRKRSVAWGLTAILPMVDFQFGLISLVFLALLAGDARWSWWGAVIWGASSLLAALTVLPAHDMIPALDSDPLPFAAYRVLDNLSALLIPFHTVDNRVAWPGGLPFGAGLLMGPVFVVFALHQASTTPLHGLLLRLFLTAMIAFSLFVYPMAIRHLTLVALLLILLKWREVERGAQVDRWFKAWLVSIGLGGLAVSALSGVRPFDSSPQAAAIIRERGLQDKMWVSWPDSVGEGIAGLLRRDMYTLRKGCTQSFIRWNFRDGITRWPQLQSELQHTLEHYGRFYMVSSLRLPLDSVPRLKLLAEIPAGYDDHPYRLYVVDPDAPELPQRPPPCEPVRLPL